MYKRLEVIFILSFIFIYIFLFAFVRGHINNASEAEALSVRFIYAKVISKCNLRLLYVDTHLVSADKRDDGILYFVEHSILFEGKKPYSILNIISDEWILSENSAVEMNGLINCKDAENDN